MTSQSSVPEVADVRLDSVIGRGTSGVVWRGADEHGRAVAVKVIPYACDAEVVEAAAMEFAALSAVAGPHVVRVHRAVPVTAPEPGLAIVMDLLEGGSLRQIVAERGRLVDAELVTVLSPIAAAVGALHSLGLVHGDLSPSNILFDRQGRPNVSDLGTAAIIGDDAATVWGTDGFVAPEVLAGGAPNAASDVYALGALGWFAATGIVPGPALTRPPLSEAAPQLGQEMSALLCAALSGEPAQRPDAIGLANAIFDAAPPAPLRLSLKDDDVSSLTRRIREAATAEAAAHPGAGQSARRPARSRLRVPRPSLPSLRLPKLAGPAPSLRRPKWFRLPRVVIGRPSSALARGGVAVLLALVVTTLLGLGWLAVGRSAQAADRPSSASATAAATDTAAAATAAASATAAATTAPQITAANAPAIVQALLVARAALWNGEHPVGQRIDLSSVHVPGSDSGHSDEQILRSASTGGWTYAGVRFTATSVALVGVPAAQQARVAVTMDSSAYQVRGSRGVDSRPAVLDQKLVFTLQQAPQGWRISQVAAG